MASSESKNSAPLLKLVPRKIRVPMRVEGIPDLHLRLRIQRPAISETFHQ